MMNRLESTQFRRERKSDTQRREKKVVAARERDQSRELSLQKQPNLAPREFFRAQVFGCCETRRIFIISLVPPPPQRVNFLP
jgi:hypothetical protein